ncbi:MAG: hypothetical protein RL731_968 [Bacteroidota bacterium]|jgi:hypothetical protein
MRFWAGLFLFFFGLNQAWSQTELKQVAWSVGFQPQRAFVYAHTPKLSQFKGSGGTGFQIDLNRYRLDTLASTYSRFKFNSGFAFQWMRFDSSSLGTAFNFSYFLEPVLWEYQALQLRLRAAGGLNLATRPYDQKSNPTNPAYSFYINGYLGLGLGAYLKVNNKLKVFANATYSHFSNGNTGNPNFGLNYPHIGVGLDYSLKTSSKPIGKTMFQKEVWRYDIGVFASNKSLPILPDNRFWVYGALVQTGYRYNTLNALTLGVEMFRDHSMRTAVDSNIFYLNKDVSINLGGLLLGHEFIFNRCIFSQQLGMYFFNELPSDLVGRFYHRWGFNYKLHKQWMLGLNLNANLQKAFLFDLRMIYSLYQ